MDYSNRNSRSTGPSPRGNVRKNGFRSGTPRSMARKSSFSKPSVKMDIKDTEEDFSFERGNNFKVVIRVRPPLPRELDKVKQFQNVVQVDDAGHVLTVSENLNGAAGGMDDGSGHGYHTFTFDHVYGQHCCQSDVYENTAKGVVESSLEGYNATMFAYGQTGTGKTYTMEGFNSAGSLEDRGIIPRAIEQIFMHIEKNVSARMRFLVRASYLQIYNESISDLLKPERYNLSIREDKKRGVFVEGLSEWVVRTPAEIYGLMERGGAMRATASTKMNEISSRSHAVFIIIAEQSKTTYVNPAGDEISFEEFTKFVAANQSKDRSVTKFDQFVRQSFKVGKLNLVDLAGSERVRLSGATGQRLEESKKINQSLSALGNVISALTVAKERQHIPYRDSKLTRILEDSLGGNCKTTMMAMISPALESMMESLSTLKFANRAKHIKNEARVNEDLDQKSLLRKYERELNRLRSELDKRTKNVVDKRRMLELDEQRRRAEQDKMAAIRALEERSQEFMKEKQEKKHLEHRIAKLTSQMLMSHSNGNADQDGNEGSIAPNDDSTSDNPKHRTAVKDQQDKIRKEYEEKLADLEKERETIEEEKAQVDRYKQLLLKQRDIMIALTQRLNERDEQIMALQDELDAYDRHQKALEEKLDEKTAQLIHLQRVTIEQTVNSGTPNADIDDALGEWGKEGQSTSGGGNLSPISTIGVEVNDTVESPRNSTVPSVNEAETKVKELTALLQEQQLSYAAKVAALNQAQTEKESMESMYLEKLESMKLANVVTNDDDYSESVKKLEDEKQKQLLKEKAAMHQERVTTLEQQLRTMEGELERNKEENSQQAVIMKKHDVVKTRCDTLIKERRAVQTIMEHKIKALVTAVSQASNSTIDRAGGIERIGDSGKWLQREVAALQRLVNASIAALRNADTDAPQATNAQSVSKANTEKIRPNTMPNIITKEREIRQTLGQETHSAPVISVEKLIQQRRLQMQQQKRNNTTNGIS